MVQERIGKIIRIADNGLAHVLEEGPDGEMFPFTFDKINGYAGERLKDLKQFSSKGLREGVVVKLQLGIDSKVFLVRPIIFRR